jgi:hypothetical protein
MNFRFFAFTFLLLLLAVSAIGQAGTQRTTTSSPAAPADAMIVQVIAGMARPGSEAQYIEGRKRHVEWHRSQKDQWAWHAYDVISGENSGAIVTVTSPHKWADRDAREKFMMEDQADVMRNIAPYASPHQISYWVARSDMSRAGAPKPADPPTPYYTVQYFDLHVDAMPTFVATSKRIAAALDKINAPGVKGLWYQLVNGGESARFALVTPRKNWAEFGDGMPGRVDENLQKALGPEGATLIATLRKSVKRAWTEALQHRDDISYHPDAK